ncbi:MAG: ATP-binding cassette domain-containing protein [Clostridiales Family XIII bacterium]|jgi:molybdate transport system ATP-binding protein|nr:ATP-binding cassette domain-containing protein [Clostridiales Family XIII bacterium]
MSLHVDIRKEYEGFQLAVSFTSEGGTLGILGASGSGKSLTLKCIAGLVKPSEGVIKIGNRVVFDSSAGIDVPPQARGAGYLFQSYALFPHMSVRKNILAAVRDKKNANIEPLLARFELEELADRYPSEISGGQQQRVALARIFASEPEVLLLDEPFSALDSYLRENMQAQLVRTLSDYPGDAILVTHSRDEAFRICGNLLTVDGGRVLQSGKTQDVFAHPRNTVTARLTGCKNFSRLARSGDGRLVATDWGYELTGSFAGAQSATHIGIRARYFTEKEPAAAQAADYVSVPVEVTEVLSGVFEHTVLLRVRGADAASAKNEEANLWWICPVSTDVRQVKMLYAKKSDLLFMNDEF